MCVYGVCVDLLFHLNSIIKGAKIMKKWIFLAILGAIILGGCDSGKKSPFGFSSNDCNEVYSNCLNKCIQSNKTRVECVGSCERSRGMCEAIKVKGCMQNCNKRYGKGTLQAETCKKRCADNRGVN